MDRTLKIASLKRPNALKPLSEIALVRRQQLQQKIQKNAFGMSNFIRDDCVRFQTKHVPKMYFDVDVRPKRSRPVRFSLYDVYSLRQELNRWLLHERGQIDARLESLQHFFFTRDRNRNCCYRFSFFFPLTPGRRQTRRIAHGRINGRTLM